ncbi:uncharacterized protein K452DRAFT_67495 [Aplosporella prunicola CBS 121167]|uniref:SET domain-containing protein n=1 Tax=Aplosporella prunicola CBS 121167 TaxID=1176127 RepID=A0A6A6BUT8_9PEZI|nr:uncharacterized protein K452DRAFT_67495 [Aplosporella prunicola CBS 121167]KAF2146567.1 hypothetical protein K452DRAFT_67495 [Aplosporella prunicola CBS 121167]
MPGYVLPKRLEGRTLIDAYVPQILTNSLTLVTSIMDPLGLSLDPYPCTANHSCAPNAFVLNDGATLVLRAMRPIAQDEELFVSYIDGSNPFHKRQAELLDRYYFTCKCAKCTQGPTGAEDAFAPLTPAQTAQLPSLTRALPFDTPAPAPDAPAEEHLRAIETAAFAALDQAHRLTNSADPTEPLRLVSESLRLLKTCGGFAPARQPRPALRDELVVFALAAGQLVPAWQHAAARHVLTDKTLLPASHPLRAVHAFVFSTLTALLIMCASDEASGGEAGAWPGATAQTRQLVRKYGIELGTVLYGVLGEVVAAVPQGHGVNSRFARAVGAAMERMGVSAEALGPERLRSYAGKIGAMWEVVGKMVGDMEF